MIAVSVIIPVYNAAKYLKQCLDSVMQQTLHNIEIIIIDDGSTDQSSVICQSYFPDKRVQYHYKRNEGLAAARQDGIDRAKGEYIGFVDSDDWCEPDMFEKMYQAALENDSDIVFCNCFENEDRKNRPFYRTGHFDRQQIEEEIFPLLLIGIDKNNKRCNARWSNCLRIYRRKLIEMHNIAFDRRFRRSQDLQFTFECTIYSERYTYLGNDYLYHNRQYPGSLSRGYTRCMWTLVKPLIQRINEVALSYDAYDFKPLARTTAFFLVADCILNEMKPDAPNHWQRAKHIREIVQDPLCIESVNGIVGIKRNFQYWDIYLCVLRQAPYKFLCGQWWEESFLKRVILQTVAKPLFKSKWFTACYKALRRMSNKNYVPKHNGIQP